MNPVDPVESNGICDDEGNENVQQYRREAELGSASAQHKLARFYQKGSNGVAKDKKKAAFWFRKAAKQGYAKAQYRLGMCRLWGKGVSEDDDKAVKWLRRAAEQGYAKAQYELGECYHRGFGVDEDEQEAVSWYQKSARQGYRRAISTLEGRGMDVDFLNG